MAAASTRKGDVPSCTSAAVNTCAAVSRDVPSTVTKRSPKSEDGGTSHEARPGEARAAARPPAGPGDDAGACPRHETPTAPARAGAAARAEPPLRGHDDRGPRQ